MCDQVSADLPNAPWSVGEARDLVRRQGERWDLGSVADDLALPASELVTNALIHAGTRAVLTLSLTAALVEVAVQDGDLRPPAQRPPRPDLIADIERLIAATTGPAGRPGSAEPRTGWPHHRRPRPADRRHPRRLVGRRRDSHGQDRLVPAPDACRLASRRAVSVSVRPDHDPGRPALRAIGRHSGCLRPPVRPAWFAGSAPPSSTRVERQRIRPTLDSGRANRSVVT